MNYIKQKLHADFNKVAEQSWEKAFNIKSTQMKAFLQFLTVFIVSPAELIKTNNVLLGGAVIWLGLEVTLPAAIIASPVFFVARSYKKVKKRAKQCLESLKQKFSKQEITQQAHKEKLNQKKPLQKCDQQQWQQSLMIASKKLFIEHNKKMIIVSHQNHKAESHPQTDSPYYLPQYQKNQPKEQQQKQFIFIIDKDKTLFQVISLMKKKFNNDKESFHLFLNSKVLNSNMKIQDINTGDGESGVIRLKYAKIQTFG